MITNIMGGGGFMQDMVNTMKNNARPKRDYFHRFKNKTGYKTEPRAASLSEDEAERIKHQIKKKQLAVNKKILKRNVVIWIVMFLILILSIVFFSNFEFETVLPDLYNKVFN